MCEICSYEDLKKANHTLSESYHKSQGRVRELEKEVADLYDEWSKRFMMAMDKNKSLTEALDSCEKALIYFRPVITGADIKTVGTAGAVFEWDDCLLRLKELKKGGA